LRSPLEHGMNRIDLIHYLMQGGIPAMAELAR